MQDLSKLSDQEVLDGCGIQNITMTYYQAKRSRIFQKDVMSLTHFDNWKMEKIRKLVGKYGKPTKVSYEDDSTPQEDINRDRNTEREYDYQKGKIVVLEFGDDLYRIY